MDHNSLVISSKLNPPLLRGELKRPRLTSLGLGESGKRVMTITADPGYGKTTLMAQIAKSRSGETMWYQVDAMDEDPMVFLRHLIYGASNASGIKAPRSKQRLEDVEDIASECEQIVELLCMELEEGTKDPLTLCFDDSHFFKEKLAPKMLGALLEHQPQNLYVIMTSRHKISLPLGKFRSAGVLQEVRKRELRFSHDEVRELIVDTWGLNPPADVMDKLHERVDGWAAGLVLMETNIREHNEIPRLITNHGIRKSIYGYLAEEALEGQPEDFRDLLMHCSVIDPVDPQIVAQVIGNSDTQKLLEKAEKLNLFTSRLDKTMLYRLHPLFRAFLHHLLMEKKGSTYVRQLHKRYGIHLEEAGDWAGAIRQFLSAECPDRSIPLLETHGLEMFTEGEHLTLSRWLDATGTANLTPPLFVYRGKIKMISGMSEEALEVLRVVEPKLESPEQRCECNLAIAECLGDLGQWQEGIQVLKEIDVSQLGEDHLFEIAFQLGGLNFAGYDQEGLRRCCDEAKVIINGQYDPRKRNRYKFMRAMLNMRRGIFKKSYDFLTSYEKIDEIHGIQRASHINTIANCLLLSADYQGAKEVAEECFKIVTEMNQTMWLAPIYDTLGCIEIGLGNIELSLELIEKSLLTIAGRSANAEAIAHCHKGTIMRWTGYHDDALEHHMKAERIAIEKGEIYDEVMSQVNIAADHVFLGNHRKAQVKFNEAEKKARRFDFGYAMTKISFHKAWLAHLSRNNKASQEYLNDALRDAGDNKQNHFIIQEGRLTLDLFPIALVNGIKTEYICWVLKKIGVQSLSVLKPLLQEPDYRTRLAAVNVINNIDDIKGLQMLRIVSRDKDERVRKAARATQDKLREQIKAPHELITSREMQVIELLNKGAQNSSIAKDLFISEQTVKTHITNIMRKLGLNTRLEIALFYQNKL